ncbi:MAG TPA: hydantoinase/oxoprolinase family protein [Methanoregulaceae archaeon]|nr:hydantoinase/oxoprolinase family protein [Methanoregulaceae archaeon]
MIGIDIGGANLKIVDERGVHIHYCPLWEEAPLGSILAGYRESGDENAAVVMSGELADCFASKMDGIRFIADSVREIFPHAVFYGTDAHFHNDAVPELAAANWLASADFLRNLYPDSLLVDMGSTTTDIIPLTDFPSLLGLTDIDRLRRGYLVYCGLLRTTIPALIHEAPVGGIATPVSTEYFASSADAHLVLGHITQGEYACDPPDRGGKDLDDAYRRLARVVCADLSEIGIEGAITIARTFWEAQKSLIQDTVRRVKEGGGTRDVISAGIGSQIMAKTLGGTDIGGRFGEISDALPAFAVREVAKRDAGHLQ